MDKMDFFMFLQWSYLKSNVVVTSVVHEFTQELQEVYLSPTEYWNKPEFSFGGLFLIKGSTLTGFSLKDV